MFGKRQLKIQIVTRTVTELRLHEWQADKELSGQAKILLGDSRLQLMLAVLHNEHPALVVEDHHNSSLEMRAILQARAEGYSMCLANLEALGQFKAIGTAPDATFEPEELRK
jgi:hypothetical protein